VEGFLSWAARVPHSRVGLIREHLAHVRVADSPALSTTLYRELLQEPVPDFGRHLVLLATIGELRQPDAAEPLERFVWRVEEEPMAGESAGSQQPTGILQARAVEMLAYLGTDEADQMVLRAMSEHPYRAVRSAAVDAYLFNHNDNEAALALVRRTVRKGELNLVGVARWSNSMDVAQFEAQVTDYYRRNHDQHPPLPERAPVKSPQRPSSPGSSAADEPTWQYRSDRS
jgi:hypothetical protein